MTENDLERNWFEFQLNVASLRRTLGPRFNDAGHGRKGYQFLIGQRPENKGYRVDAGATVGEPNGVPDVLGVAAEGSFTSRLKAVVNSGAIVITFDSLIQTFAGTLEQPSAFLLQAGEALKHTSGLSPGVRTSIFLHALANHHRHVDEWALESRAYIKPQTPRERSRQRTQSRSMEPLATVLGCAVPIKTNVTFDGLEALMAPRNDYYMIEWHVLRVGQDVAIQAGLSGAHIGVTKVEEVSEAEFNAMPLTQRRVVSGPGHAAD